MDTPTTGGIQQLTHINEANIMPKSQITPQDPNHFASFENYKIRKGFLNKEWVFSVVDVLNVLTGSSRPEKYWSDLKTKMSREGSEISEKIGKLKFVAVDGKKYTTDVANRESIFRIIQSVPSPKAEPFKLWLAQVAEERFREFENPDLAVDRAINTYKLKGYDDDWIQKRIQGISTRNRLTEAWINTGIRSQYFGILTNTSYENWAGMNSDQYKEFKKLEKGDSLRNNFNEIELLLNQLAEFSNIKMIEKEKPSDIIQHNRITKRAATIAKETREKLEKETGETIISPSNYLTDKTKKLRLSKKKM